MPLVLKSKQPQRTQQKQALDSEGSGVMKGVDHHPGLLKNEALTPAWHRSDHRWFKRHPSRVVRFRSQISGEFDALRQDDREIPHYRPVGFRTNAPLNWVAVVDLQRLAGSFNAEETMRIRLQTCAIRSDAMQRLVGEELAEAIAAELLCMMQPEQIDQPA